MKKRQIKGTKDAKTFLAFEEALISRRALAPRSRASGSNPAEVVLGLSFRTLGGEAEASFPGGSGGGDCLPGGEGLGEAGGAPPGEGGEVENGLKLKGPSP